MGWTLYFGKKETVFVVRQEGEWSSDEFRSIHGVDTMRVFGKIVVGESKR